MSCSKYAYIPSRCGDDCPGDCDNCPKREENLKVIMETDKFLEECGFEL